MSYAKSTRVGNVRGSEPFDRKHDLPSIFPFPVYIPCSHPQCFIRCPVRLGKTSFDMAPSITTHGEVIELKDHNDLTARGPAKEFHADVKPIDGGSSGADDSSIEEQDGELQATKSTREDAAGMRRMGKEQQLVRNFRLLSITSFVALATAAWEIGLFVITPGLVDGGRSGLIYNTIWNFLGFAPVYLSMAEMASM